MAAPPIEMTQEQFLAWILEQDEDIPLVRVDSPHESRHIRRSNLGCYPLPDGGQCEALVFAEGLILVSPEIWDILS